MWRLIFPLHDTIKKTTVQNPSRKPATQQKAKYTTR